MYQVCNRPVLVALVAGQSAFEIENESDQYVVNKMMKALRKIYGDKIPDPNKFYKTSWHSDPFARGIGNFTTNSGSYSYIKVGSKGGIDYDIMSQRVNRFYFGINSFFRIFFAGEATCRNHPSTVLGGLLSGFRASGQIDDYFDSRVDSKKRKRESDVVISRERAKIEYTKLFSLLLQKRDLDLDMLEGLVEYSLDQNNSKDFVFNTKIMIKLEKYLAEYKK
jgi:hypothetical protein